LKLESDKYCETKLFFKMDMYFETEGVQQVVYKKIAFTQILGAENIFETKHSILRVYLL